MCVSRDSRHNASYSRGTVTRLTVVVEKYRILFDIVCDYSLIAVHSIENRSSTNYR